MLRPIRRSIRLPAIAWDRMTRPMVCHHRLAPRGIEQFPWGVFMRPPGACVLYSKHSTRTSELANNSWRATSSPVAAANWDTIFFRLQGPFFKDVRLGGYVLRSITQPSCDHSQTWDNTAGTWRTVWHPRLPSCTAFAWNGCCTGDADLAILRRRVDRFRRRFDVPAAQGVATRPTRAQGHDRRDRGSSR
jgi:hypothetical protein